MTRFDVQKRDFIVKITDSQMENLENAKRILEDLEIGDLKVKNDK